MRKLPHTAAEDLLEVIMRRYERASTLPTSNRAVDYRGKLRGAPAAVAALLVRLLDHAHVLKCGPSQLADQGTHRLASGGTRAVELRPSRSPAGMADLGRPRNGGF
jgi:hypothetical protein